MNRFSTKLQCFFLLLFSAPLFLFSQNYTILGDAVQFAGCNCYRFTENANNQGGAIYQDQTINLNNSFDFTFSIFLGCNNGSGADGLVFVLTSNPNGLGNRGGGLGYAGGNQPFSLGVEFDTYYNSGNNDIQDHHIGINSGGNINHNVVAPVQALPGGANIDDCQNHDVRIVWDVNTNTYEVYFDGVLRVSQVFPNMVNDYFGGNPIVNWGWSGATGGSTNEHRICVESTSSWVAGVNYQSCSQTVQFTDVSTSNVGNIQSWSWNFGDGNTSNLQNPVHTYSSTGTYNVSLIIVDVNGCNNEFSNPVVIADSIVISATLTEPPCNGGSNGGISATASSGFGPSAGYGGYAFNWSNGQTLADNSGITAGTYVLTVTDGVCSTTEQYTLDQPTPLTATTSATDASCGANNGSVSISISGGTPPYQNVSWAGVPGATRNNLPPNTYIADFEDINGCSALLQYTATVGSLPCGITNNVSSTNVSCLGGNNGSISLTVTGGSPPANVNWNHGPSGFNLNGLAAGTYTYNYSDANPANNFSGSVTITEPPVALQGQLTVQNTSCANTSDGSAVASVTSGGNPPYTYNWSGGLPNNPAVNNLPQGPISLTIIDNAGCEVSFSDNITGPPTLTLNIDAVDDSCYQSGTGSAMANVSGGNPPYTYFWDNISSAQYNIGLDAGEYYVTVTDDRGCTITGNTTIGEPDSFSYDINVQDILCAGDSTGSIEISNLTGGNAPYTYSWTPNSLSGNNPTGLGVGNYTFEISDDNGCSVTDSAEITELDSALAIISSNTDVTCNGADDGSISIEILGGAPPFSFMGTPFPGRTFSMDNLAPGVYAGQIEDANGCTANASETITEPDPILFGENAVDASCFGGENGSITINPSGGTSPYSYEWDDASTDQNRTGLSAGTYNLTITDSNFCADSISISISEPAEVPLNLNITDAQCFGDSGIVTALPSEGTPPYSFSWTGTSDNSATVNLINGNHDVTATSSEGCVQSANFDINSEPEIVIQETHTDVICFGESNGSIQLNVSGGAGNFTYTWQPNVSSSDNANQLSAEAYSILIEDQNNCTETIDIQIESPNQLELNLTATDETCFEAEDGSIQSNASGGLLPYSFELIGASGNQQSNSGAFDDLAPGTYTITAIDSNACTAESDIDIQAATLLDATASSQNITCIGNGDGQISATASGGAAPYVFEWQDGSQGSSISELTPGTYFATITDANGCTMEISETIEDALAISVSTDTSVYEINIGESVVINSQTFTDGKDVVSYEWQPANGLDCTSCQSVNANPIESGTYTLSIVDEAGCVADTVFEIIVNSEEIFYVPNAFTPNGDGVNDVFKVSSVGVENFKLKIFDRWGTLLFISADIEIGWDGTYNGTLMNPDVYVYNLYVDFLNKSSRVEKGSLTLIR